ncbi:hypothetical protein [Colwellia psychrerythraea]|uniref:Uncharacterized protein n=1 Tax=Colwellia psychrerythraea TaxID=28229 RepID=A0A099KK94_COLPS|nr:hypothetical protein [Colwellia psychrerythraea]KGJ89998.1 hypothetical protein ND2E_3554 [Colwellia psychrerythraea]
MSFFDYLSQLNKSFIKFLSSKKTKSPIELDKTIYTQTVNENSKANLKLKCKRAALEISSIENFTQWPITEVKAKPTNSLIYLDVSRKKREQFIQKSDTKIKADTAINRVRLTNNVIVIKKLP